MDLPKVIDCRPESILREIASAEQKFALIFFNMDPEVHEQDSFTLLKKVDCIFGTTDIKIWLDDHQLVILSCRDTKNLELFAAIKQVEDLVVCKTGIVFYPEDGKSMRSLTAKAYKASCLQLNAGPKRAFIKAMEQNEFYLVYQPQVNSKTGEHIGVEALIRWRPAITDKIIMPLEFLPIVEAEGMMDEVCKWTLYEACRQSIAWQSQGNPIRISVNISTPYLLNPNFLLDLDKVIDETGVNPQLLEIEITENKGINQSNVDTVKTVIQTVRKKGILVSLDDFGMGYNSLEILRVLTVDRIKIDKVFVQNIDNNKVKVIIQGIIGITRAIGIKCLAEGVETVHQAAILEKMGCSDMQGYLFGKPLAGLPKWKNVSGN